jgi:uncharacterized protein (DUF983 family)
MSKEAQTPKYTPGKAPQKRCPECGRWTSNFDWHDCGEQEDFDGTCPMCGEQYRSFLDHLSECDASQ